MNQIYGLDHASSILTCDAGCILEKLDNWLGEEGFMMPLDLGAKVTPIFFSRKHYFYLLERKFLKP